MSGIVGTSHSKSKVIGRSPDTILGWAHINGTVADSHADWLRGSYNFGAVTDEGTGTYDFYLLKDLVAHEYIVLASTDANNKVGVNNKQAGEIRLLIRNESDGYTDAGYCDVAVLTN